MKWINIKLGLVIGCVAMIFFRSHEAHSADWPQFMRDSKNTANALGEQLQMPLRLVAQVQLDDAVLSSPAVVEGHVFVVDQMATAYCVDPDSGLIVWKSAPEGDSALGGNTSSRNDFIFIIHG